MPSKAASRARSRGLSSRGTGRKFRASTEPAVRSARIVVVRADEVIHAPEVLPIWLGNDGGVSRDGRAGHWRCSSRSRLAKVAVAPRHPPSKGACREAGAERSCHEPGELTRRCALRQGVGRCFGRGFASVR